MADVVIEDGCICCTAHLKTIERMKQEDKAYVTLTDMIVNDAKEELKLLKEKAATEFSRGFGVGWKGAFNYWSSLLLRQVLSPEDLKNGSAKIEEKL